jgi:hypothetical protein
MNTPIDLRTCNPGDKLRSAHGLILTYVEHCPGKTYSHIVRYPDNSLGSRIDDGHVYHFSRLACDHDIVEIIKS